MSKRAASEISKESPSGAPNETSSREDVAPPVVIIHDYIEDGKQSSKKKSSDAFKSGSQPKVFNPESRNLLDDMLYPLTREEFLQNHFRKNAVCIQRSPQQKKSERKSSDGGSSEMVSIIAEKYLFRLDVHQIFAETSSENVFLWLRPPADSSAQNTLNSVEIPDPDTAYALHMSGSHPAYCRAPPLLEQLLVGSLLRATGLGGGHYHPPHSDTVTLGGNTTLGRGEVELFIGAKTSDGKTSNGDGKAKKHTTGHHTDFQENFTIQISGVKQWTLKRGRVRHPLRATTPHYCREATVVENQLKVARLCLNGDDPAPEQGSYGFEYNDNNTYGPEQTITLYPGDVLYFPSGMWHTVKTIEPGVSLNVSLMGTTYATVVCEALQHLLVGSDERWREIVTSRPGDVDGATRLQELMKGLSKTVEDFVTKGGGAQSVLPPALCYPPQDGNDDEEQNESVESNDNENESMHEDSSIIEGFEEVGSEDGDEAVQQPIGLVVDMDNFTGPSGWSCDRPSGARLIQNPLALLIAKEEVTAHVLGTEEDEGEYTTAKQYILNVNYAGNEMFESHVRVTFVTEQHADLMDRYMTQEVFNDHTPPDCLFYYGLFSWGCKEET